MPKKTILLVEDDIGVKETLFLLLEGDYHLIHAGTADEALEYLENLRLDLVITDYRMPGRMNGMDLVRHLRQQNTGLPMIMISASDVGEEALLLGVKAFLKKPFDCRHFQLTVRACIS